ncbi:cell wall metabolism sensor histidine kinase WalK [Paenibacillus sp. J5C_2022]|uniref:cell wall metabolism sensor histidine kinase WalK n=1 Tax=Paenibacillus sp. J5C2022 TaxID=2977129 RepID=UPI0021D0A6EC|nr:cell wall metabolism sensor histidine kinase WalK [Paenibacillus sp. J5C2022]MCU6710048.1 cell wall metabolism sensor histidine kinase WalK [Paenibacillus sp. J5C2022]
MKLWDRLARLLWHSVVGKLWATIMLLVAVVLLILGVFLLQYIDIWFDQKDSHDIKVLFVITAIIGFLLSTFFAFFLSAKIQQPLLQLKNAADSVSQGDYGTRVNIRSSDEIGQLANTFNHMTEQLDKLIHDLNDGRNHLASILRSMGDSVITFDAEGQVTLTNPSGHLLLNQWSGLESAWDDPKVGASLTTSVPVPLREIFCSVKEQGRDLTEKIHVHSGVWSVVMAPLQSGGVVRGAVAVIRDVTEEHKLDKLRRDFVANISHEIRTPLSMLQGYSEALLDDIVASPEDRKELVQVIHDESLRMGRLVNDFLDIARMEAGHVDMHFQEIDLRNVLRRVHRKFGVYAKEREVELQVQMPQEPLVMRQADEDRLEQVLTNLMDNALRHTPAGNSITITGEHLQVNGTPYIQLQVKDEGQGIPQEDVPYIFERFYKADKARKRGTSGGTGLGLAIVKNLIDLHYGRIVVDSVAGAGTTFTLLLPVEAHE